MDNIIGRIARRISTLLRLRARERDMDDEMRFHIEMEARELERGGLPPGRAVREARLRFGGIEQHKEAGRDARGVRLVEDLVKDLRFAVRTLRRSPGFTAMATLILALGIGANTAIFSLTDALLLRMLPVPSPDRLIALGNQDMAGSYGHSGTATGKSFTYSRFVALRNRSQLVTGLAATGAMRRINVFVSDSNGVTGSAPEHPGGRWVSPNYFAVLGVRPAIGRFFDDSADSSTTAAAVVVLSYDYWVRRFGGDPRVLGRTILFNSVAARVIGVGPPGFSGEVADAPDDFWLPIPLEPFVFPNTSRAKDHTALWLLLFARLAPGVSQAEATAEYRTLIREVLDEDVRQDPHDFTMPAHLEIDIAPLARGFSSLRPRYAVPLHLLLGGVAVLLLIVCANVSGLLLARAVVRQREIAIRLALGAGRNRIIRQLLTESLVLGGGAAVLGAALAVVGIRLLGVIASGAAISVDAPVDARVLAFVALVTCVAVLTFGLAPALRTARVDIESTLRSQTRGMVGVRGRHGARLPLGRALIATQMALSLVLLLGAALLTRSLRDIESLDTGADREHLLVVDLDPKATGYTGARLVAMVPALAERLGRVPGVAHVSWSQVGMFSGSREHTEIRIPGFLPRVHEDSAVDVDQIGPSYARTVGARMIEGRDFTAADAEGAPPAAIINRTLARHFFGDANPVGRTLQLTDSADRWFGAEIVGVMSDIKGERLAEPAPARFYLAYQQHPGDEPPSGLSFEIRTPGDPASAIGPVRRAIASFDPMLTVDSIAPLSWRMHASIAEDRMLADLATAFGALALVLAAVGLYGVMSYTVGRRTGEIGLRMALGARSGDIARLVLSDAFRTVMLGVAIGIPLALTTARLMRSELHDIGSTDSASIAIAVAVVTAASVIAALLPALRATRVGPVEALREE